MNIPIGHKNAVRAPKQGNRWFREEVEQANNNGDVIINVGEGYFRPDPKNKTDVDMFDHYIRSEFCRARAILKKARRMKEAFENGEICKR